METAALPLELLACMTLILAGLPVKGVLVAPRAIFLQLHAIRSVCLVLLRGVIATLALSACKGNECTH